MSHPIERFHIREQTYRRPRDAYRSFYKFVCKHELYGTLYIEGYWKGEPYYRRGPAKYNFGGLGFSNGYPIFTASRSEARRQWDNQFRRVRDRLEQEARETEHLTRHNFDERIQAHERIDSARPRRTTTFFKTIAAAAALNAKIDR